MSLDARVKLLNDRPPRATGDYVLYWAQMNRRVDYNHSLIFAIERANELKLPVLYYEGLTCTYPSANDRMHTFVLEGVPDTAKALAELGVGYSFYLRRRISDRNNTLYELASRAALIVTDDYPVFIAAEHNKSVPPKLDIPYYAVESSCIIPPSLIPGPQYAAYTIRPKIHKLLREHMNPPEPVRPKIKWRSAVPDWHTQVASEDIPKLVSECEIDHSVPPSTAFRGGSAAAARRLQVFLESRLPRYTADKNDPVRHATSNLSPYLHFGHISSLQIAIESRRQAETHQLNADAFLEELIVRRELTFNYARTADIYSFAGLPRWAQQTMLDHAKDRRDPQYTDEQMEQAQTYDELWNATQKELLIRGKIHGYYRIYWGKKIVEWAKTYDQARELMIHLHEKYSLDGRDPNTYTNVLWCFGLHDRAFRERPIFGKIRYLSLAGMKRKTDVAGYLRFVQSLEQGAADPEAM